jgi:hypothetical protein
MAVAACQAVKAGEHVRRFLRVVKWLPMGQADP